MSQKFEAPSPEQPKKSLPRRQPLKKVNGLPTHKGLDKSSVEKSTTTKADEQATAFDERWFELTTDEEKEALTYITNTEISRLPPAIRRIKADLFFAGTEAGKKHRDERQERLVAGFESLRENDPKKAERISKDLLAFMEERKGRISDIKDIQAFSDVVDDNSEQRRAKKAGILESEDRPSNREDIDHINKLSNQIMDEFTADKKAREQREAELQEQIAADKRAYEKREADLESQIEAAHDLEEGLTLEIKKEKSSVSVGKKLIGWLSSLTGGKIETQGQENIKRLEGRLAKTSALLNRLMEDQQALRWSRRNEPENSIRPRKIAGTPSRVLQKEERIRDEQEAAYQTRRGRDLPSTEEELEAEYGLVDEQTIKQRKLSAFESSIQSDPKVAVSILPSAAKIWDHLKDQIVQKVPDINQKRKDSQPLTNSEIAQASTDIVLKLAQFKKAMELDNLEKAQQYHNEVGQIANQYGLEDDQEIWNVLNLKETTDAERVIPAQKVQRSISARRQRGVAQDRRMKF